LATGRPAAMSGVAVSASCRPGSTRSDDPFLTSAGGRPARRRGVSCDSWGPVFSQVTAVSERNTPTDEWLAHLVWPGLGFPYI